MRLDIMNKLNNKIPKFARWMLLRLLISLERRSVAGDIMEEFHQIVSESGIIKAWFWYLHQMSMLLSTFILSSGYWNIILMANYFKLTFRHFRKHKIFTFINIAGLVISLASCFLILLWVQDELSYDRFHNRGDDLYRIAIKHSQYGEIPITPIPLAPAIEEKFPEIMGISRYLPYACLIKHGDRIFNELGSFADSSFFNLFTYPFIKGDPDKVFSDPFSIVLTEELAKKFFGEKDPMGQILRLDNQHDFTVTGVLKNIPHNSHIRFDFLVPFARLLQTDRDPTNWGRWGIISYVLVENDALLSDIKLRMEELYKQHKPDEEVNFCLQPLTKIHLYLSQEGGDIRVVTIFSVISLFILLIACINFINLTTARSSIRAKEVGLRKVIGAQRKYLIRQFMGQAILLSGVAFFIAIILVMLVLPGFNNLSGKVLSINLFKDIKLFFGLLGIALLTGFLSGVYPSFLLSAFQPAQVLKGAYFQKMGSRSFFRRILVIVQFSISICLIICTMVISRQIDFMSNRKLGYDTEQIVYFPMQGNLQKEYPAIKAELLKHSSITHVAAASELPTEIGTSYNSFGWEGKEPDTQMSMNALWIDPGYFEALNIKIIQGRAFSKQTSTDENNFILNETAIKLMGIESPVGKRFSFPDRYSLREGIIVGVVNDFHFASLHYGIGALALMTGADRFNYVCIRVHPDLKDLSEMILYLENIWNSFVPEFPFEIHFLDEVYNSMYRSEQRISKVFRYFTVFAIFISCLGLFGLAAFITERRTKEIGIRKVLGASALRIVKLLSREFVILVLVANIVAWPISFFVMKMWLEEFAYHTNLRVELFLISGFIALLIAFLTVSYQAFKAGMSNPVDSLRCE